MWSQLIFTSLFIVYQLLLLCHGKSLFCHKCHSICITAQEGKAKEYSASLNRSCTTECLNYPFKMMGEMLNTVECAKSSSCLTAHALLKYKVSKLK